MPKSSSNRGLVLVTGGPGYIAGEGYGEVYQQPSRKNPVWGSIEQTSSRSPRTFRGELGRPPPFPLSSLSIADSWIAAIPANTRTGLRFRSYRISEGYEKPFVTRGVRHEVKF